MLNRFRRFFTSTRYKINQNYDKIINKRKNIINDKELFMFSSSLFLSSFIYYHSSSCNILLSQSDNILSNWSASHFCKPKIIHEPETIEEIEEIIRTYHKKKQKIRCKGSGLSPNGLGFCSDGQDILSLGLYDKILNVDTKKKQVWIQSGVVVRDLVKYLHPYGLTLQNVASIREQQFGGITQAGCHGTGAKIPPIDDQIVSLEIVTPAKGKIKLSNDQNPNLFNLAKCGLGSLGIITEMTIQCVPVHKLIETTKVMTLEEVKKNHIELLENNQHLRYMWIPHTNSVVVVSCNPLKMDGSEETDIIMPNLKPLDKRLQKAREYYLVCQSLYEKKSSNEDFLDWSFTTLRDKILEFNPSNFDHVKKMNEIEIEFWRESQGIRIGYSDEIIGFDCGGQQLVLEVAFPLEKSLDFEKNGSNDIEFVEKLLQKINDTRCPLPSPIEQRWTSASASLMNPAYSNDSNQIFSWVGIVMYLPLDCQKKRNIVWQEFKKSYEMLEDHMEEYDAYEHWAKIEVDIAFSNEEKSNKTKKRMRKKYPIDKFNQARDELDPDHILTNQVVSTILEN